MAAAACLDYPATQLLRSSRGRAALLHEALHVLRCCMSILYGCLYVWQRSRRERLGRARFECSGRRRGARKRRAAHGRRVLVGRRVRRRDAPVAAEVAVALPAATPAAASPRRSNTLTLEHGLVREHAALDALQRLGPSISLKRPEHVGAVEAERRVTPPARVDGRRYTFQG